MRDHPFPLPTDLSFIQRNGRDEHKTLRDEQQQQDRSTENAAEFCQYEAEYNRWNESFVNVSASSSYQNIIEQQNSKRNFHGSRQMLCE